MAKNPSIPARTLRFARNDEAPVSFENYMSESVEHCAKCDFDQILEDFRDFWDDDATRPRHHPMFVIEFGDSAWAIRELGCVEIKATAALENQRSIAFHEARG